MVLESTEGQALFFPWRDRKLKAVKLDSWKLGNLERSSKRSGRPLLRPFFALDVRWEPRVAVAVFWMNFDTDLLMTSLGPCDVTVYPRGPPPQLPERQSSTPSFGLHHHQQQQHGVENGMDQNMTRTSEIENIPEVVEEETGFTPRRYSLNRELRQQHLGRQESVRSEDIDDLPPPPPSPPPLSSPSPPPPPPPYEEIGGYDEEEIPPPPTSSSSNFSPPPPIERGFSEELERPFFHLGNRIGSEDHTEIERNDDEDDDDDDNDDDGDNTEDDISSNLAHIHQNHSTATPPPPPPRFTSTTLQGSSEVAALHASNEVMVHNGPPEDEEQQQAETSLNIGQADLSGLSELSVAATGVLGGGVSSSAINANVSANNGHMLNDSSTSNNASSVDKDDEHRRKGRHRPSDTAYYIAKELLMTERTYKKDLEVLCVWFRNTVSCDPAILNTVSEILFSHFDPIYNFHYAFLKEVEHRLASWEGKTSAPDGEECQKIGDILLNAINTIQQLYDNYFEHLEDLLTELDAKIKKNRPLEEICRGFESQKMCYLPLNTFFLRPGQRLLHFKLILERLVKHYPFTHHDTEDCKEALCQIIEIVNAHHDKFQKMENLQKLMELQRDLIGLENLVHVDREFKREGCLQKFSRKGYQQRMFFLFSDMLVYTSRTSASLLQFKVHGQLPLRGMTVEETDPSKSAVLNSFAIYAGNKYILVAASSQEEKDKWIEDINEAVTRVKTSGADKLQYPSLKSSASSSENVGAASSENDRGEPSPQDKPIQHRANTTTHVCWHRNTSVSMRDHEKALRNHLSGYLLRKFKSSNGWQKLWVVFTNFCLFFYKTYQDDYPLASLPLLGYAVSTPEEEDGIHKDHVFKLQFKNHVYFFRAESEYTFSRWMEVINWATHNARRIRLFSRLDSRKENNL